MQSSHAIRIPLTLTIPGILILQILAAIPAGAADDDIPLFRAGGVSPAEHTLVPPANRSEGSVGLPGNAIVRSARVDISPFAAPGSGDYPLAPAVDVGKDGDREWAYEGTGYGRWGMQTLFANGSSQAVLDFESSQRQALPVKLPATAAVQNGSFIVSGNPVPYWHGENVLTPPQYSPGEFAPKIQEFGDILVAAWESLDGRPDYDIAARVFNGTAWGPELIVSPPGGLNDTDVEMTVYDGRVYLVWDAIAGVGNYDPGAIYIRSFDGANWGPVYLLSAPASDGWSNMWPHIAVFNGRLYVVWISSDPNAKTGDDFDVVYREYDGAGWGPVGEVTPPSDDYLQWSSGIGVYNGRLYVAWDTQVDGAAGDWDLYIRSFDGRRWDSPVLMSPAGTVDGNRFPDLMTYRNPLTGAESLFAVWLHEYYSGYGKPGNVDIVARQLAGTSWGPMTELTAPSDRNESMYPHGVEYGGRLYVLWVTGTNVTSWGNGTHRYVKLWGDVVVTYYDGTAWHAPMELTPLGRNDNASDPGIGVYNGKLYAIWNTPNATAGKEGWSIVFRNIDSDPVVLSFDFDGDGAPDGEPANVTVAYQRVYISASALETALRNLAPVPDRYGNPMVTLPLDVKSFYPSVVLVRDLEIRYGARANITGLEGELNDFLAAAANRSGRAGNVSVPVAFSANSSGGIAVVDAAILYIVNLPPFLIAPVPDLTMDEDTSTAAPLDLEHYFGDDWDDGRLRFDVTVNDTGKVRLAQSGRFLNFSAEMPNWNGRLDYTVKAYDRFGLWAVGRFNLTVLPVNDPPVLDALPAGVVRVGEKFDFTARAFDADGDDLTFSDNSGLFDIGPATGRVTIIPGSYGNFTFNITVDDGHGGNDTKAGLLTVLRPKPKVVSEVCAGPLTLALLAIVAGSLVGLKMWQYLGR